MWVNGKTARLKAKALFIIQMVMFSKGNLRWTKQMVMEHTNTRVDRLIKEAGLTICKRDKARKYLLTEAYTRAHSTTA